MTRLRLELRASRALASAVLLVHGAGAAAALLTLPGVLAPGLAATLLVLGAAALWRGAFHLIWIGFAINVLSGIALLAAYPAKALTNPVFYAKMIAIAVTVGIVSWLQRQLVSGGAAVLAPSAASSAAPSAASPAAALSTAGLAAPTLAQRRAAVSLLALWLVATVCGRFLAYTHSILMARDAQFY